MLPSLRALVVALVLGSGLLAVPAAAPHVAMGVGPLPPCKLLDILTIPRGYDDWRTTLVDWNLRVGRGYKPPDLVSVSAAGLTGGGQIREVAFDDLKAMADAARHAGAPLGNVSSYRSYAQQVRLFNGYAGWNPTKKTYSNFRTAITFSARPGHSEHQLGLVIDFADAGRSDFVSEEVGAGKWLAKNAWKYGWLMSYPKGKSKVVCYRYEPWHYRYFGRELAKEIHDSGLTTREYLWSHFTQVQVPSGKPVPTASAAPSTPPTDEPASNPPRTASPATDVPVSGAPTPAPATSSPGPPPIAAAGTWFGLDPPVVIVGVVLILGSIGALAALGLRRPRGSR
jgi:LAS superfamily LD-carboxypeptidase LdcB